MTLWLARAGKHGEDESVFFGEQCLCMTWEELTGHDLTRMKTAQEIKEAVAQAYPESSRGRINNWAAQIGVFALHMKIDDLVVMPLKGVSSIAIGIVESDYYYDAAQPAPYKHRRKIRWVRDAIPRAEFSQDLLYSFGAFMTFCRISRNDAESRVKAMLSGKAPSISRPASPVSASAIIPDETEASRDIADIAYDELESFIARSFKGHGMERLVAALLRAQGYAVHHSDKGADGGVDILASSGKLGFGEQRICVQVKSTDGQVDLPTFNQLIGTMQNVKATHGLLVGWGGFTQPVRKEAARQFFNIRLWNRQELIGQIQEYYDAMNDEFKAELPLKRVWILMQS